MSLVFELIVGVKGQCFIALNLKYIGAGRMHLKNSCL